MSKSVKSKAYWAHIFIAYLLFAAVHENFYCPLLARLIEWIMMIELPDQIPYNMLLVNTTHCSRAFLTSKQVRDCLHGGGVPQIGEVTRLGGATCLSI